MGIYVNKQSKHVLLNKFSVTGEVKKDTQTVMKALLTTNEKPYKMSLYMPALLNKIYRNMDNYEVTVNHQPGQLLEVKANGKKFTGFKIARVGGGNNREFEINGKKLGSGDYELTDNSFKTKITIADGNWIEPKITWQGRLPNNAREAESFFLKNSLTADVKGSKRHFNADLDWNGQARLRLLHPLELQDELQHGWRGTQLGHLQHQQGRESRRGQQSHLARRQR